MELAKLLLLLSSFWITLALARDVGPFKDAEEPIDLFWAARGKKSSWPFWQNVLNTYDKNQKRDDAATFWAARGKKYSSLESDDAPFWAARGKKDHGQLDISETPFWAARGKRATPAEYKNQEENNILKEERNGKLLISNRSPEPINSFWAARGKKTQQPYQY